MKNAKYMLQRSIDNELRIPRNSISDIHIKTQGTGIIPHVIDLEYCRMETFQTWEFKSRKFARQIITMSFSTSI